MRTYKAFYNGRQTEVTAETSLQARDKAALEFKVKPKNAYQVTVILCDVPVDIASL